MHCCMLDERVMHHAAYSIRGVIFRVVLLQHLEVTVILTFQLVHQSCYKGEGQVHYLAFAEVIRCVRSQVRTGK